MSNFPSDAKAFLIVYPSRSKVVGNIALSLLFLLGSLGALFIPAGPNEDFHTKIAHTLTVAIGLPIFSLLFVLSFIPLFSRKPLLVFDEKGITTQQIGLIPWSEIAEVKLLKLMEGLYFAIIANDTEGLAMRLPEAAKKLRLNQKNMGVAAAVSEHALPMKAEQLLAQVKNYSVQQVREHS